MSEYSTDATSQVTDGEIEPVNNDNGNDNENDGVDRQQLEYEGE